MQESQLPLLVTDDQLGFVQTLDNRQQRPQCIDSALYTSLCHCSNDELARREAHYLPSRHHSKRTYQLQRTLLSLSFGGDHWPSSSDPLFGHVQAQSSKIHSTATLARQMRAIATVSECDESCYAYLVDYPKNGVCLIACVGDVTQGKAQIAVASGYTLNEIVSRWQLFRCDRFHKSSQIFKKMNIAVTTRYCVIKPHNDVFHKLLKNQQ